MIKDIYQYRLKIWKLSKSGLPELTVRTIIDNKKNIFEVVKNSQNLSAQLSSKLLFSLALRLIWAKFAGIYIHKKTHFSNL